MNLRMHFETDSRITATAQHGLVALRIEEAPGVFAQISMRADHVTAFYAQLSDALTPHIHEATLHQIEKPLAKAAPRDEPLRGPARRSAVSTNGFIQP